MGTRLWAALTAALLTAALLSACGSSDSDSSGSTATEPRSEAEAKPTQGDEEAKRQRTEGEAPAKQGGGSDEKSSGSSSKDVATPLEVSGGGSGRLRAKGGDNSIQEFGEEGDESELREVAEIVHGFYVARAEERWDKACTYLSKSNIEQLEQLAARSDRQNVDCGTVLKAFTRTLPDSIEREITTVDARSFRHDSKQGFLIYYGADKVVYAMPLLAEGGTWKVTALAGSTLLGA